MMGKLVPEGLANDAPERHLVSARLFFNRRLEEMHDIGERCAYSITLAPP